MADSTVSIELNATDNASPVVGRAAENAETAAKRMNDGAAKSSQSAAKGFSALRAITHLLHGNFVGMGQELAKLSSSFRASGAQGVAVFSAVGAAITGAMRFASSLGDLLKTIFNTSSVPKSLSAASAELLEMKSRADDFAAAMAESRDNAERQSAAFRLQIDALERMTKAQNEFNRAQELALANTEAEKAAINAYYNSENAEVGEEAAARRRERERSDLEAEEKRIEQEIAEAEQRIAGLRADAERFTKKGGEERTGAAMGVVQGIWKAMSGSQTGNDKATRWFNQATEARNAAFDTEERLDELRKRLEDVRHRREIANIEESAAVTEQAARRQTDYTSERERVEREIAEEAVESAKEYDEYRKKAEADLQAMRLRNVADLKAASMLAAKEESAARERLAAAQSAVSQAWGWYRDKGSMAAQLAEEKSDADARVQYEKDFSRLKSFRHDWRTAKNLSVDDEAVRRVALAREEQNSAARAVQQAAQAAEAAERHLMNIENILSEGGAYE